MTDQEPNLRALRREWWAARAMAALGALLLIAVAVIIGASYFAPPAPAVAVAPPVAVEPSVSDTREARRQEDIALCNAALATAQKVGLVPGFATRDGDEAQAGTVQGRYVCRAKTDVAKYAVTFDLACTRLGEANCIVLVTVAQDGAVLYQKR